MRGPLTCCAAGDDTHCVPVAPGITVPVAPGMRAAAYTRTGGPDVLEYVEVPDPELRPGGIILAVEAVSIQGGDLLHRAGGVMATNPHVVGYQAAGTVREVGVGGDRLRGRPAGRRHDGLRQPRRAGVGAGAVGVRDPRRAVDRAGRRGADRVRHRRRLPLRVRPPAGRRGRPRAGGRGWRRAGRDPARQGGGREHRHRHRVERRAPGAAARPRHGPRHQLRPRGRRGAGARAHRTGAASTSSSIRSAAPRSRRASPRSPTAAGSAGSGGPAARPGRRRSGR